MPSLARILALGVLLAVGGRAQAQTDWLPSWKDGAAKKSIVECVQATTTPNSLKFVPPVARIASLAGRNGRDL